MSFQELIDQPLILQAIEELGYATPTPIQQQAIPLVLKGNDLRASAQTGSGKTAAFLLPALARLAVPSPAFGRGPRILVLVPTRELAIQVAEEAVKFSKYLKRTTTVCIYGGAPYPVQNKQLSRPFEILVATPGRLIDHMERGRIDFSRVEMLVLDEADRMLDMGFIEPVEQIAAATPPTRQTVLFSATLKGNVLKLSERLLKNPVELNVAQDPATYGHIEQRMFAVDNLEHKYKLLDELLISPDLHQAIVFTATKRHADELEERLHLNGHKVAALHGDMNQRQRTRTITNLRNGMIRILVATDVAARGIDIPAISHVINFDLPNSVEDYVHRIGRTGRAGATGIALSFVSSREQHQVRQIERYTSQKTTVHTIPGLEPKQTSSEPRKKKPFQRFGQRPFAPKKKFGAGSFSERRPWKK